MDYSYGDSYWIVHVAGPVIVGISALVTDNIFVPAIAGIFVQPSYYSP